MASNLRIKFKQYFKWAIGLFLLLFLFRFIFGFTTNNDSNSSDYGDNFFGQIQNLRKNYASEKSMKFASPQTENIPTNALNNQKYEKTASIKSKSAKFEDDKKSVESKTNAFKAIVQYEKNEGKKDSRELHLLIGVNPTLFDSFYVEIQKIGSLKATEITKIDKTNEYKQLNAKRISVEKTLVSLNELKSKGAAISDNVLLLDKILENERQLQELGVELGNFDAENEFCTVRFSLFEGKTEKEISLFSRIKIAIEWTFKYYLMAAFALVLFSLFFFLLLLIIEKLNIIKSIVDRS